MTVLNNNGKTIQISLSDIIHEEQKENKKSYVIVLPLVVCNSKSDAKYIQESVNTYVTNLSKELLK